jgi:hypothetical protein
LAVAGMSARAGMLYSRTTSPLRHPPQAACLSLANALARCSYRPVAFALAGR